jgi:hypothetical protein
MNRLAIVLSASLLAAMGAQSASGQVQQGNLTHGECIAYKSNGYAFNAYPAMLNVKLPFVSIDTITGTVYGQNWKSGLPDQRPLGAATDWHNGGYLGTGFGTTGGWKTSFFYNGAAGVPNTKDLIDLRFGAQDGISPGKGNPNGTTAMFSSTQPLYIVQRNRDSAQRAEGMTLAGFDIKICGMVPGPQNG